MLSIFRTNQLLTGFLYIFYVLLFRVPYYVLGDLGKRKIETGGYLSEWFWGLLSYNFWLQEAVLILFMLVQAFLINILVQNHRLAREVSLFPGLFYLLLISTNFTGIMPGGIILASTFFTLAIWEIFETYRTPSCADSIFNIGLWIGLASLCYASSAVLIVWAIIGLNLLRVFKLKEHIMVFLGAFTPYLLIGVWAYWRGNFDIFYEVQFLQSFGFDGIPKALDYWSIGAPLFFAVLLLVVVFSGRQYLMKQNIQVQKKIQVLQWSLLVLVFSPFLQKSLSFEHIYLLAIPVGIFLSFNFINMSRRLAESLHFMWLFGVLALLVAHLLY